MEWWQILVVGMGFLGTAAALTYGVLVAVVREKERIYQRRKRTEEERSQLALMPLVVDKGTAQSELPGLLARRGVRISRISTSLSLLVLRVETKEIQRTHQPTSEEMGRVWNDEWYQRYGCRHVFARVSPGMAGHRQKAMEFCPAASEEQWKELATRLTQVSTSRVFKVVLEADGELLLEGSYTDLLLAAEDIRTLLLALEPDSEMMTGARWEHDKARMTAATEEGGEVVKLKRG